MAEMSPIVATIDGTSCTFRLLESDIPTLTFANDNPDNPSVITSATLDAYLALVNLAGVKATDYPRDIGPFFAPNIFRLLVTPNGRGDYGFVMPTGKALLARAAVLLANLMPYPVVVRATLTLALKGGMSLDLKTAAGMADTISRSSSQSVPGKMSYVHQTLVPQILNAAASA
jgi:hypothetical protein